MKRNYFGTDGIPGKANEKITIELALKIGRAAGLIFRRLESSSHRQGHASLGVYE
jgi:phosphoglucosamine mutase